MRLSLAALVLVLSSHHVAAFSPSSSFTAFRPSQGVAVTVQAATETPLNSSSIAAMSFRELQKECSSRGLEITGTTATLRGRLKDLVPEGSLVDPSTKSSFDETSKETVTNMRGIEFIDQSDPDYEFKELLAEVMEKASVGHWKTATRKLKKLKRWHPENTVPEEAYLTTLRACMADRLHGARASEPARKIMEQLVDDGYEIPGDVGNYCVQNCLGDGPNGTHDGCGGIDTALAMLAAVESTSNMSSMLTVDTYGRVVRALIKDGAIEEGLAYLRSMVVDRSLTPPLEIFADVATATLQKDPEKVLNVLAFAKAAGYELDNIAATQDGRNILACGVIAAEKMDNLALGLRLLTAAGKAKGCAPDRGDDLVASSSSAAQRACTLIHKRAINASVNEGNWKLAVRLLEIMTERSLVPSPWVWRNVVTCCAKAEKSKKATALLLDWAKLARQGQMEKPPVSVFNTVVNVCEICEEQELTLLVLDAMKKTHDTEGNIITFNIALKRLAKQGNTRACEGIIIGMLQAGVEPSVVSYTTAIAACVSDQKDPVYAYEWLKRMRSRNVMPNVLTYNTALAACLDGKLESTMLGSKIATEMLADVDRVVASGDAQEEVSVYTNVMPDLYTKGMARQLMKQLRENWRSGDINMQVAKATLRVSLLKLVDFEKSGAAQVLKKQKEDVTAKRPKDEDEIEATQRDEVELEYAAATVRRVAEV